MTTDTMAQTFAVNDRVKLKPTALNFYESLREVPATVISRPDSWGEMNILLDTVPEDYANFDWMTDERKRTVRNVPASFLEPTDVPNPDPRLWPSLNRGDRVIWANENGQFIGTIQETRPADHLEADYRVVFDDPSLGGGNKHSGGQYLTEADLTLLTQNWTFHGIIHQVDVRPDHSNREGGGWVFKVNNGLSTAEGWVRPDAARALGRLLLGLPAEPGDDEALYAKEDY